MVTKRQNILACFTLTQSTHLKDENETKMKEIGGSLSIDTGNSNLLSKQCHASFGHVNKDPI